MAAGTVAHQSDISVVTAPLLAMLLYEIGRIEGIVMGCGVHMLRGETIADRHD